MKLSLISLKIGLKDASLSTQQRWEAQPYLVIIFPNMLYFRTHEERIQKIWFCGKQAKRDGTGKG